MKKYALLIFLLIILIPIVLATDDNIYIKENNVIKVNNEIKIINSDKIISDLLMDNDNIYYFSNKTFYIVNKTNGIITFKFNINNIKSFKQTEQYIYFNTDDTIYQINKTSGEINKKYYSISEQIYSLYPSILSVINESNFSIFQGEGITLSSNPITSSGLISVNTSYNFRNDSLFNMFSELITSSFDQLYTKTIFRNVSGDPLGNIHSSISLGINNISIGIVNVLYGSSRYTNITIKNQEITLNTDNGSVIIDGINLKDEINTRVNKSGDIITGQIDFSNQTLRKSGDIYQSDQYDPNGRELISYQAWDLGSIAINFFSNSRKYNNSAFAWEFMDAPIYPGGSFILFGQDFIYTNFPSNSTVDERQFEYIYDDGSNFDIIKLHSNVTIDNNLKVGSLAGSGNAYACLDQDGKIYRNINPCV